MAHPTPRWQPITQLPMIAGAINGMAESAATQVRNLQRAETRPHVLDDYTVNRVIAAYTQQQGDLWLYAEQLTRWEAQARTSAQRAEVAELTQRLATLRADITTILDLAARLKPQTIDTILARSDAELGLDALLGAVTPRGRRKQR
ncbi:MAG: hypothetical protein WCG26_14780 [Chloroflexales bacterium]